MFEAYSHSNHEGLIAASCIEKEVRYIWVIRDRGRVSGKSGYVRSAPKATELLRRHEMTRWATTGSQHHLHLNCGDCC
jgi:hypothetical protein